MSFVNVDGSIACILRTCRQTLLKLRRYLQHQLHDPDLILESARCSDAVGRLLMWDSETGAGLGRLDHGLRKSSRLRDGVLDLLRELVAVTKEAISSMNGKEKADGGDAAQAHEPSPTLNKIQSISLELGSSLSASTADLSSPLHEAISELNSILDCLLRQVPALQDPTPHDSRTRNTYEGAYFFDLTHITNKFPNANEELLKHLGVANWKRRQELIFLRAQIEEAEEAKAEAVTPWSALKAGQSGMSKETQIYTASEAGTTASQYSTVESIGLQSCTTGHASTFSRRASMETVTTSMSGASVYKDPSLDLDEAVDTPRLNLPRPPAPNSNFEGKRFKCPYCSFDLVRVTTLRMWRNHVMTDLEPYLCTYGDCLRPAKTYGSKNDWIQHEIEVHRTEKRWFCKPCDKELVSRQAFDEHMREKHTEFSKIPQLDVFAEICQKTSAKLEYRTECPLCLQGNRSEKRLRRHLADHLEQIALFAALRDKSRLEDDDTLDLIDDSESDENVDVSLRESIDSLSIGSDRDNDFDLMEDSGSDGNTLAESVVLDTQDDSKDQMETRQAAIERYLGDQVEAKVGSIGQGLQETSTTGQVCFPVMTMVHPPNEYFFGRDQALEQLHQNLSNIGDICVIHGAGGIGKTLTTVEYVYRYKDEYECIFWLQADTSPGLAECYADIARELKLVEGNQDQSQIIELSRHWLDTSGRRWLLIFDNVEVWNYVISYLPQGFFHSRGSIIVTTRSSDFATRVNHNLPLQTFAIEEGSITLLQYLNRPNPKSDPDHPVAQEISGLVGGLPVALSHVAGLAAYSECTLSELLEIFKQRRKHTEAAMSEDDDLPASFRQASYSYDETLTMVWNVTLRELPIDPRDMIYILAYLSCEAIPESMLFGVHQEDILDLFDSREPIRYTRMKRTLIKRRLIQTRNIDGEACLSLHRSLQRSIQDTILKDTNNAQLVFDQALVLVRKAFPAPSPTQAPDPMSWCGQQRLLPHVRSLLNVFIEGKDTIRGSKRFAKLLSDAGINQWAHGFTRDGLSLLTTAERVLQSVRTDSSNLQADILSLVALMQDNMGISTRAESLRRRELALKIRRKYVEGLSQANQVEETLLYNSSLDYGISLLQYNKYQEVESILDRCLEKYRQWGTPDDIPYEYAKYGHKMGLIRMYQGRYEEALELCRDGVQQMEKTGNDSLMLRFKFDLACIHLQKGDIKKSLAIHKEVLNQRLPVCGKSNENTLQSYYAIGALEEIRGNYAEAEANFRHALDRRRTAFWSTEAIARTQYHLAKVLWAQGKDNERATKNYEEAKETLNELLPLDFPDNLKDVQDEEVLFDHLLTVYGARFTGTKLLEVVR